MINVREIEFARGGGNGAVANMLNKKKGTIGNTNLTITYILSMMNFELRKIVGKMVRRTKVRIPLRIESRGCVVGWRDNGVVGGQGRWRLRLVIIIESKH